VGVSETGVARLVGQEMEFADDRVSKSNFRFFESEMKRGLDGEAKKIRSEAKEISDRMERIYNGSVGRWLNQKKGEGRSNF